jgi:hypothetical protein
MALYPDESQLLAEQANNLWWAWQLEMEKLRNSGLTPDEALEACRHMRLHPDRPPTPMISFKEVNLFDDSEWEEDPTEDPTEDGLRRSKRIKPEVNYRTGSYKAWWVK